MWLAATAACDGTNDVLTAVVPDSAWPATEIMS
jgi:hypothetical protein